MMRLLIAALLIASVVGCLPAKADETAKAEIKKKLDEYVAAFNRGDAKGAAATYAVDGTHTYALGFTHRGRAAIEKGLEELLAGPMKGAKVSLKSEALRLLTPDIAVEEESFVVTQPADRETLNVSGLCLAVHQRVNGAWLAAAVECMVPFKPPEPPAK